MDHYASNSEPVPVHRSFQKTASSRKPSTYIFDAHGQTALILDTFKAQPFNWETETIWLGKDRASVRNAKKKKLEKKARKKALTPVPQPLALSESPVSTSLSDMEIADPISAGLNVTRDKHLQFLNGPEKKPGYMNAETDADSPNLQMQDWEYGEKSGILRDQVEIRMLVSGKHLALASSYFEKMFSSPFTESKTDGSGLHQVKASDWDPEAFNIILTIIHGYHRDVPRLVSLEMLAKLAIIVDYYDCHESIELHVEIWLENLKSELPTVYGRDCILYMLISWVFTHSDIFQKMTRLALRHSGKLIECEGLLPLPTYILEEIDEARQDSLDKLFSAIYDLLDRLLEETECSYECSSMSLGVLTKELSKHGILSPRITQPFDGWSIDGTKEMIKGLRRPKWYDNTRLGSRHSCTIQEKLSLAIDKVEDELRVFDLQDLQFLNSVKCV